MTRKDSPKAAEPVPFLDLGRHCASIQADLEEALLGVLNSHHYVLGPRVARFEREFSEWCGVDHGIGVASGTDAIALALQGLGVGPGDEVLAPANTCIPTVAAIESIGAIPVLADVDAVSLTISPEHAAAARTERTRAVVAVHLYGRCADVPALRAALPGIFVVEDAAQAHGAAIREARAGSLGDAAAFSFYPTKNLGCLGDGGMVLARDPDVADRVRRLRAYGERERYLSVEAGRNSRLDELQAAVLSVKLRHLTEWNQRRRTLASRYTQLLAGSPLVLPSAPDGWEHAHHLYVVRLDQRDRVQEQLAAQGLQTMIHYPRAVHEHPAYRRLAHGDLEVSERLARTVLSLPLYPELRDDELERVATALMAAVAA